MASQSGLDCATDGVNTGLVTCYCNLGVAWMPTVTGKAALYDSVVCASVRSGKVDTVATLTGC